MGSGVAWRLARIGFDVTITEIARPAAIRRWVCFAEAIYDGERTIEDIGAVRVETPEGADAVLCRRAIPVLVLPEPDRLPELNPDVIVDATLRKRDVDRLRGLAARTVGCGPGFTAGVHVDCVIETNRGPNLGRCLWTGSAEPDTGVPGQLGGETVRRVLRAPRSGQMEAIRSIGERVRAGDVIARVGDADVAAPLDGVVRGLIRPGIPVTAGQKIGDVDPRGDVELCRRISDKALAIAGGVLEAILSEPPPGGG